jgi:hypothetical protein
MKALPKKLLPLTVFAIAVTSLVSLRPVQAYTVTLEQVGSNVVANGSGAINLMGLSLQTNGGGQRFIDANSGAILTGQRGALFDLYFGFTGPTSFGSGGGFGANASSGDVVGIFGLDGFLPVPLGYVSGNALLSSSTFDNATFDSLGVTPGTYVWTWGTGLPNQNFTLIIPRVGVGVPDGGSTVSLLGFALLGLVALRRKFSC